MRDALDAKLGSWQRVLAANRLDEDAAPRRAVPFATFHLIL